MIQHLHLSCKYHCWRMFPPINLDWYKLFPWYWWSLVVFMSFSHNYYHLRVTQFTLVTSPILYVWGARATTKNRIPWRIFGNNKKIEKEILWRTLYQVSIPIHKSIITSNNSQMTWEKYFYSVCYFSTIRGFFFFFFQQNFNPRSWRSRGKKTFQICVVKHLDEMNEWRNQSYEKK